MTREIIKDIEDFEGDIAYGRNTVPVVIGVPSAKIVSVSLIIITIAMLYLIWYLFISDTITFIYITSLIVLPLLYVIYKVIISRNRKQLHRCKQHHEVCDAYRYSLLCCGKSNTYLEPILNMIIENLNKYRIILASRSPRRQQLLRELGIKFDVLIRDYKEHYPENLKGERDCQICCT